MQAMQTSTVEQMQSPVTICMACIKKNDIFPDKTAQNCRPIA